MQPGDSPITRADLEMLKRDLIEAFRAELARAIDPVALACALAEEDPVPPDPAVLAEMDAALHDDKPGIAFDQVMRELGL